MKLTNQLLLLLLLNLVHIHVSTISAVHAGIEKCSASASKTKYGSCNRRFKPIDNILEDRSMHQGLELLLSQILEGMLSDLNCLAIINDNEHQDYFGSLLFKKLSCPYYKIMVQEKEDLQSPNYNTLSVIQSIRRHNCKAYIILLSNGWNMGRFLQSGDRYRFLDTRAKFLILYDRRLFHPEMHYLWMKFINVVFIRWHAQEKNRFQSWYDLSTVPFPSTLKQLLVPKQLDSWHDGQFRFKNDLFESKTADLKGHTLMAATFPRIPGTIRRDKSTLQNAAQNDFSGVEVEILKVLGEAMNFQLDIFEPQNSETEQWGHQQLNGSYSGILGEILSGEADVGLGNLHYTPYYLEMIDLTVPYTTQCLTFLTPESLTDNSWKTLILPFRSGMWAAILIALFLIGFIFYGLALYHHHIMERAESNEKNEKATGLYLFSNLNNGILYTYGMLLLVSLPKFPTGWSIRVLTGWWWIYCILLAVAYRASLTAILANPAPRVTIDTMEELVRSKISCGAWGEEAKKFFENSLDDAGQKIADKLEVNSDTQNALERIEKGEYAYYENIYFLQYLRVMKQQSDQDSDEKTNKSNPENKVIIQHNLHIMQDCAIHMPVSLGLQRNSPFKTSMDPFIHLIVQAGLVEKWLHDTTSSANRALAENGPQGNNNGGVKALMNMHKLYGALVAMVIGYFISITVLVSEILHWYFVVQKSPFFDKYAVEQYYKKKQLIKNMESKDKMVCSWFSKFQKKAVRA